MDIEKETETTIKLDGDGSYDVDVWVDGEHEWDIAVAGEPDTKIRIREQE